jgi:hypothetical protein
MPLWDLLTLIGACDRNEMALELWEKFQENISFKKTYMMPEGLAPLQ